MSETRGWARQGRAPSGGRPAGALDGRALPEAAPSRAGGLPGIGGVGAPRLAVGEVGIGGAGQAETGLAARLDRLRQGIEERLDAEAMGRAREAGAEAGAAGGPVRMEGGGALYRSAFNAAAAETGMRRLEAQVRDRLDGLAREHESDPGAFLEAARAYRDGVASGLPEGQRQRFALGFDTLARPYGNTIVQQQERLVAGEAVAAYDAVLPRRLAALERLGRQSVRDGAALAALRAEEEGALADLARLGPRGAFTFAGQDFPADPSRAGALTLPQMEGQRRRLLDAGTAATAMGAFEAGPRTEAWIQDWVRARRADERNPMAPELLARIEREMRGEAAEAGRVRTEGQQRAWGQLQERVQANEAALALTGRVADDIPDSSFLAAGRTPDWIAAYRRRVAFGQHAFTVRGEIGQADEAKLGEIEQRLLPGGDLFALNPAGSLSLAGQLAQRREGAARAALDLRVEAARAEAGTPPPQHGRAVPEAWRPAIAEAAARFGLPEGLARELIGLESGGRAGAVSPAGAVGPAQIMAATAAAPGFGMRPLPEGDRTRPEVAIPWGMEYLSRLRAHFGGDIRLALAAYNAGPGRVEEALRPGGRPLPLETQRYIAALLPYAGAARPVSDAEARAAGLSPEQRAAANRSIALAAEGAQLRQVGATGTPEEVARAREGLPIAGPEAADNLVRFQALEQGLARRLRGAEAPADYVMAEFPAVAEAWRRAAEEPARLPAAVALTLEAQERLGIPPAQRQPVPRPVLASMVGAVERAADPDSAGAALRLLRAAVGPERLVESLRPLGGAQADLRREALAVAAVTADRDPLLARRIVAGAIALRDNPLPGATSALTEAEGDRVIGGAFQLLPAARSQLLSAARAAYAAEMAARGALSEPFDTDRFAAAITQVQPFVRWGGAAVPLPAGLDARRFNRLMDDLPPAALDGARALDGRAITPAMVARGGFALLAVGPGVYELRYGAHQVLGADGRAFRLDLAAAAAMPQPAAGPAPASPWAIEQGPPPLEVPAPLLGLPPRDPQAPVGSRLGLGGTRLDNRPVGSRATLPGRGP